MYLRPNFPYYMGTEQRFSRENFLILVQPDYGLDVGKTCSAPLRAFIRKGALRQVGHWMMGTARVHGHTISLSGTYGADGLTCNVPPEIYEKGLLLPKELDRAWRESKGGWNCAGNEGPAIHRWALEQLNQGNRG